MRSLLLTAAGGGAVIWIIYIVFFIGIIYFFSYRPQKKERERMKALLESLAIGDSVITTSGFYGIIIDMTDDTVIIEFGNNKNCRIPMKKEAIMDVEKPDVAK